MTEKNIFVYILFLPLNISDFSLFSFRKNCNPLLKKVTPSFPATPLSKLVLSSPSLLKIWWEFQPPQQKGREGGGCTLCIPTDYEKIKLNSHTEYPINKNYCSDNESMG